MPKGPALGHASKCRVLEMKTSADAARAPVAADGRDSLCRLPGRNGAAGAAAARGEDPQ